MRDSRQDIAKRADQKTDDGSSGDVPILLVEARTWIDRALESVFESMAARRKSDGTEAAHRVPDALLDAMRYATLDGGKRLRPALVFGAARAVGGHPQIALAGACAVELVHAYSLVHDDLPALDNDDERRGKPSCHKRFGEATALLAGDALLTEAMSVLVSCRPIGGIPRGKVPRSRRRLRAAQELLRAVGAGGMIGGQHDDITVSRQSPRPCGIPPRADSSVVSNANANDSSNANEGASTGATRSENENRNSTADSAPNQTASPPSRDDLLSIHRRKTGRLIQASTAIGAILAGGTKEDIRTLRVFGAEIGVAFQLVDDILDRDGLTVFDGVDSTRKDAMDATERGIALLRRFGHRARPLASLATHIVGRVS